MEVRQTFTEWLKSLSKINYFHGSKVVHDYGIVPLYFDKNGNKYSQEDLKKNI